VPQPLTGLSASPSDAQHTFSGVTARLEVDYKPVNDLLIYLSYNRGGKSGGYAFSSTTPFSSNAVPTYFNGLRYKPETLDAFEFGAKASIAQNTTLNFDVFNYAYHNYQAFAQYNIEQTILNLNAHEIGAEAELTTHPIKGLTLSLNVGALSSRVVDVPLPDGSFTTHNLPQTPHLSGGALARYEFPAGPGEAHVQGNLNAQSRFCFTVLCAPDEHEPGYMTAGANIGYAVNGFELSIYGANLTDRMYRTYTVDNSLTAGFAYSNYAPPRTWGLSVEYKFGSAH
jgi:iron complex outermembrane receptor protein